MIGWTIAFNRPIDYAITKPPNDQMRPVTYRDLHTLVEFAAVVALEHEFWGPGYDEVVPVPILAVTSHRGGILVGAFDGDRMIRFLYSLPGIKHNRPTQRAPMLRVPDAVRNDGVRRELKLLHHPLQAPTGLD